MIKISIFTIFFFENFQTKQISWKLTSQHHRTIWNYNFTSCWPERNFSERNTALFRGNGIRFRDVGGVFIVFVRLPWTINGTKTGGIEKKRKIIIIITTTIMKRNVVNIITINPTRVGVGTVFIRGRFILTRLQLAAAPRMHSQNHYS